VSKTVINATSCQRCPSDWLITAHFALLSPALSKSTVIQYLTAVKINYQRPLHARTTLILSSPHTYLKRNRRFSHPSRKQINKWQFC